MPTKVMLKVGRYQPQKIQTSHLKQGDTTIYPVVNGYAVSVTGVHVKQLKTNHFLLVYPSFSSITDTCFTEIERKINPTILPTSN